MPRPSPPDQPDQPEENLVLRTIAGMDEVDRNAWDALANPPGAPHNPFVSWDFLQLLEETECVSIHTGWQPMHIIAETPDGALHAAAPAYIKSHSQGEFVFDHAWANAFERAGGQYYPKLLLAAPFSPVPGPRLLTGGSHIPAPTQRNQPSHSHNDATALSPVHASKGPNEKYQLPRTVPSQHSLRMLNQHNIPAPTQRNQPSHSHNDATALSPVHASKGPNGESESHVPAPTQRNQLKRALLAGVEHLVHQLGISSAHMNFPTKNEWDLAGEAGYLQRTDQQFMWFNRGYETFDDFLAALSSRKRKNLKKERAAAQNGLTIKRLTGDELRPEHWDAFFAFYMDTGARKWGTPYLNRDAFALLHERMADQCLLVLAYEDENPIAGALNLIGTDALFGRYWGALVHKPFLHFELCYYQAIEECIARGLARAEAGAQGGHKMARGYEPTPVYSAHYIAHEGFRLGVSEYLERERQAVDQDIAALSQMTPFKKGD